MPALELTVAPLLREKPRILIVEDESLVAADLEERLNKLSYEVCGQADTCDGAVADALRLKPDLVLMDIHLIGKKDGVEAANQIHRSTGIPVVFLTAHADDATLARIGVVEPFGYVVKPFDERELKATIEVALYRHQAESRLKKMERWLATTLSSIGDGVIATDLNGKVKFINAMTEALTGWLSHMALGRDVTDVFILEKGGENVSVTGLLNQALQNGAGIYIEEGHFLKARDGRKFPVDDSISVIRDDDDKITGWVIVFRDVSARLDAEQKRIRLEGKMREAQRLEGLGVMAGGIAHDFNNLLQVVVTNVSLSQAILDAKINASTASKLPALLNQIKTAADQASRLCTQMLAYAGQGRFEIRDIELTQFTRSAINLLRVSVHKSAKLVLNLAEGLPSIRADTSQLQQIIMNLVINASDALDGKPGTITVETRRFRAAPAFISRCHVGTDLPGGDYILLKVSDTGCGMTPEMMSRIFDPFFTTKFLGRGLGLAAVTGIVRDHGGALSVESTPGRGTCFQAIFPPVEPMPSDKTTTQAIDLSRKFSGRVLLVDDDPDIRTAVEALLGHLGFDVELAENGRQAVEKILESKGDYYFVLMDLMMPVLSGHEAFKAIHAQFSFLPIIIMSGYSDDLEGHLFQDERPTAFLHKPFSMQDLVQKLCNFIDA